MANYVPSTPEDVGAAPLLHADQHEGGGIDPITLVTGPTGPQGELGNDSTVTGPTGPKGTTWFNGTGEPVDIEGANVGDYYIDISTGDVYILN